MSLLHFDGSPNRMVAEKRLRAALTRTGWADAAIEDRTVTTPEEAERLPFRGSPTVLIDGRDPFLGRAAPVGLSCRVYRTDNGLTGAPSVEQLVAALGRVA